MKQKLIDIYRSLLDVAAMKVSPDGYVSVHIGDPKPALIKGKRLVLPTTEHLKNPDWSDRIAFHPLAENPLHGESEVLKYYRKGLIQRTNYIIGMLGYQLLTIATSTATHAKLSPEQSEFLSLVKEADEKTMTHFEKLMEAMSEDQTKRSFVNIYLKRAGKVNDVPHNRVGVVSFPLYEELAKLEKGDYTVYGVKLRVRDVQVLKSLLEYIIPNIQHPEQHVRGSMSRQAPYLDALMKSALVFAAPINAVVELFANQLEDVADMTFDDAWVDPFTHIDDLASIVRSVPQLQSGNSDAEVEVAPVAAAPAYTAPPPARVVAQHAPQVVQPYPNAYQQMAQQAELPKTANGKLDMAAVMRSNPGLAQQAGLLQQPSYGYAQQPQGMQRAAFDNGPSPLGYNLNGRPSWGGGTSAAWGAPQGRSTFGNL